MCCDKEGLKLLQQWTGNN